MSPWEVMKDMGNPYRRALLLRTLENRTPIEDYLFEYLPEFLRNIVDIHGASIINSQRKKKDHIKHIFRMDKSDHKYTIPDPKTGKMITVETH